MDSPCPTQAIVEVAHRPRRVAQLTLGSALVTGAYAAAMLLALRAAGSDVGYSQAAFAYLAGSAVSTVAPTPGGLGVVEAALVAVYTAVGVEPGVAIVAVLLFQSGDLLAADSARLGGAGVPDPYQTFVTPQQSLLAPSG